MTLPETTGDFIFQASVFRGELANALTSTNLYTNAWQKGEFLETSDFPWRNSQHFATLQSPPGSSSHRLPDTWSNVSEKILQGRAPRSHHFTRNEEAPTSREGRVSSILEARMHHRCVVIKLIMNPTLALKRFITIHDILFVSSTCSSIRLWHDHHHNPLWNQP